MTSDQTAHYHRLQDDMVQAMISQAAKFGVNGAALACISQPGSSLNPTICFTDKISVGNALDLLGRVLIKYARSYTTNKLGTIYQINSRSKKNGHFGTLIVVATSEWIYITAFSSNSQLHNATIAKAGLLVAGFSELNTRRKR